MFLYTILMNDMIIAFMLLMIILSLFAIFSCGKPSNEKEK